MAFRYAPDPERDIHGYIVPWHHVRKEGLVAIFSLGDAEKVLGLSLFSAGNDIHILSLENNVLQ